MADRDDTPKLCPHCQQPTDASANSIAHWVYTCRACRTAKAAAYYLRNRARILEQSDRRYQTHHDEIIAHRRQVRPQQRRAALERYRSYGRKWQQSPAGRAYYQAYLRSPAQHPKVTARRLARYAVSRGQLIRQPCESCGALTAEMHHDSYLEPLTVRWLCPPCHRRVHSS